MGTEKPRRPVHEAMRDARAAIRELGPSVPHNSLGLDLRAALINLDASLERALGDGSDNLGAGPDQLEVYARLALVEAAAAADGSDAVAAVRTIVARLDRRAPGRARRARLRRADPDSSS